MVDSYLGRLAARGSRPPLRVASNRESQMSDDFVRLYEESVSDVYGYFVYRLGSRAAAEASTRATFERALRDPEPFGSDSDRDRVRLLTIARATAAERSRPGAIDGDDPGMSAELAAALDRLERVERAVLALRYGARLEAPEIARVLDLSETRTRRALSRGLRRLRTELELEERPRPFDQAEPGSAPARLPGRDQEHREQEQGEA
jgi:DNA-directed RNA polymerase specialized sigma24 family protein